MPKIIENLDTKIIESAFQLFAENGYNDVSMKIVADQVGIAVGTLYNYYSNKRSLFLYVFKNYLSNIYQIINEMIADDANVKEFITVLYDEILKISGFSEEIIRSTVIQNGDNDGIINILRDNFICTVQEAIASSTRRNNQDFFIVYEERMIRMVLFEIIFLSKDYPEEREKNIDFISDLINELFR